MYTYVWKYIRSKTCDNNFHSERTKYFQMSSFSSRKPTSTKYAHTHSAFVSLHPCMWAWYSTQACRHSWCVSLLVTFFFSAFSPFQCLRLKLTRPIAPGAREFCALLKCAYCHQGVIRCCHPVSFFLTCGRFFLFWCRAVPAVGGAA